MHCSKDESVDAYHPHCYVLTNDKSIVFKRKEEQYLREIGPSIKSGLPTVESTFLEISTPLLLHLYQIAYHVYITNMCVCV